MWNTIGKMFKNKEIETPKSDSLLCPKCKNDKWIEGPGGGSFGNIQCGKCETKYNNMGPFGLQEIKY
jgi:hypothetical protein